MRAIPLLLILIGHLVAMSVTASAQMIQTQTPMQNLSSSYFEQMGVQTSLRGPNFFFSSGQGASVPFGNPDPNSGMRGGTSFRSGGLSGNLRFNFAQGSSSSISSTTPSLTTMNGYPGSFSSQVIRPFVTGFTPIVGDYPTLTDAHSMARVVEQQQASQLRQQQYKAAGAKQQLAAERFRRGVIAEESGDLKKARANYRLALGTAQGSLRAEVVQRMRANGW